jgi:hypothetical protein
MMDRGSFNGPGGPHMRWVIPAAMGASMPAGLMLRNRIKNGFIAENQVLTLSREELARTGPIIAKITARAVEPLTGTFAGIVVRLDGNEPHDRTPVDDPSVNPLSPGIPNFDYYSVEVVQRIGYDSFCPDNGVLIAKNKDRESRNGGPNGFNCFNWVIDAHPEDINKVDYLKPDGTPVMRTIADYRQLNDALFHAGLNTGSQFEWTDIPNRLHFYIINLEKNPEGILIYKVGVRSLDGTIAGNKKLTIEAPPVKKMKSSSGFLSFTVKNIGEADSSIAEINDIYRVSAKIEGAGWDVSLLNTLFSPEPEKQEKIDIYLNHDIKSSHSAVITLTLQSESNPLNKVVHVYKIRAGTIRN